MNASIDFFVTILSSYILRYALLAVELFFTIRLGFIQFLHFPKMFRRVLGAGQQDKNGITAFQALTVSLACRVAPAISPGLRCADPGRAGSDLLERMVALVGMAAVSAESTLAQVCKINGPGGMYRGGPATTSPTG